MNATNTEKIVKVRAHVIVAGWCKAYFSGPKPDAWQTLTESPVEFETCRMIEWKQCLKVKKNA